MCPWCIVGIIILVGALVGGGVELGVQAFENSRQGCPLFHDINWGRVGIWSTIGAATSGIGHWVRAARAAQVLVRSTEAALPAALRGGTANVHVYLGISTGKPDYVGITNDLHRRALQHGSKFELLEQVTSRPVTRGQARAIEEALIVRNPGFQNARHAVSPRHPWYREALEWGEAWLRTGGR